MSGFRLEHVRWAPNEDDIIRALWPRGLSATEVAKRLPGRSRNAVIGRAHRLGVAQGAKAKAAPPQRLPRAPKVKAQPRAKPPHPGQQGKVAVVLGVTFPPCSPAEADKKRAAFKAQGKAAIRGMDDTANDNAVLLIERRFGQCAWPVGQPAKPAEQLVCGASIYDGIEKCSYCLGHAMRAFTRDITQPKPKENLERASRRWAA